MITSKKAFITIILTMLLQLSTYQALGFTFTIIALVAVTIVAFMHIFSKREMHIIMGSSEYWLMLLFIMIPISMLLNMKIDFGRIMLILCCFGFALYISDAVNNEETFIYIIEIYAFFTTVSTIVLVAQYMNQGWAFKLQEVLVPNALNIRDDFEQSSRYAGLCPSILTYGYQCSTLLSMLIIGGKNIWNRKIPIYLPMMIINTVGLALNRTRSAIIVVLLACIIKILMVNKQNRKHGSRALFLSIMLISIPVGFLLYIEIGIGLPNWLDFILRLDESNTNGTIARIPMLLTAFNHALHNPLGVSVYDVRNPSLIVGATTARQYMLVLNNSAHNVVGNIAASYGFLGVLAFFMWLIKCVKESFIAEQIFNTEDCYHLKVINEMVIIAILSLVINSLFHNASLISGEVGVWLFFGLHMALTRLSRTTEQNEKTE